jgi:flagellar M-ring protein FliF
MFDVIPFMGSLSGRQRAALIAGLVLIVALVTALGWWAFRAPYGVLFSDLAEQDAGAIVQELDKLKVPYQISPNGQAILVPEASVHKTRMTLMGRPLPLHGAVGFELFNNAEFGASDFVQKVNYQRALQGELTRTIASIEQVQSARVHLALPDQGLFRKDASKAKASVTVVTQAGHVLSAAQVIGIQRLVGASVPEVHAEDVTVLDQHGVTLSRAGGDDTSSSLAAGANLDSKLELERHLSQKATQVLDRMFGKGASLVTVDVVLNTQQTKVTTEEVLPAANQPKDQTPTGVVVRERTVTRDAPQDGGKTSGATSTSQEMDYATGKRIEQVVSPSGTVARVNVAVVLKSAPADQDLMRVRDLVAASVGVQASRGDVVAVYSMAAVADKAPTNAIGGAAPSSFRTPDPVVAETAAPQPLVIRSLYAVLAAALALAVAAIVWHRVAQRARGTTAGVDRPRLTANERQSVLNSVQVWLAAPERQHET